jgi:hypothetical protein
MGAFLTTASTLQCPHGGMVQAACANTRAKAGGAYILRSDDTFTISGCPFNVSGSPHPCVRVQWIVTATRNTAAGGKSLTDASVGLCMAADGAPKGTALVESTQPRATGM